MCTKKKKKKGKKSFIFKYRKKHIYFWILKWRIKYLPLYTVFRIGVKNIVIHEYLKEFILFLWINLKKSWEYDVPIFPIFIMYVYIHIYIYIFF